MCSSLDAAPTSSTPPPPNSKSLSPAARRMLRATGRHGDAWFPGFAHRPKDYAQRLEVIRSAASDAGRDPMSITPAFWMPVIAGPSRDAVDAALESTVVKAWALNAPAEFYAHHGATHPMGADFSGMQDHAAFTMDERTIREKSAQVALSVVKGMILNGTVDKVLEQAAEWRDHGVRYIVVVNFGPMQPGLRNGMATMLPFTKVVRGLKRL
jgi:phthiodiolone/phenolphthiodiolone dimycocerosates ketoreductase